MTYALAFPIRYAGIVKGQMLGNKGWLDHHNRKAKIQGGSPGPGGAGAVSLTYISAVTITNTTDGTPLTNGVTSLAVPGVYVDPNAPIVLTGAQIKSFYTDPDYTEEVGQACGNGLVTACQNDLIADLVAGTPGLSVTLPVGSANFEVVSGNEDVLISAMTRCVTYMMGRFQVKPEDLAIALSLSAYGFFTSLRATGVQYFPQLVDGIYTFMGVPIFPIAGTGASGDNITGGATNFGAYSNPTAYVTYRDSLLLSVDDPYIHGGGPIAASDGTTKLITKMPYAHAVVSNFFAEVLNAAS